MAKSLWVMLAAFGRPELVRRTIASIAACEKPPQYAETLVVENGPPCGIEQIVREFSPKHRVRYLYSEQPNKSVALNLGLAHTDGGLIAFTDDDVRMHPQWLAAYAAATEGQQGGRYFGGPVHVDAEHGLPPPWMRRFYPATLAVPWELPYGELPTPVPGQTFMGPNWAAFGSEILALGGFDPNLGPGPLQSVGEETEVMRQLGERGSLAYYVPAAMTWHYLHRDYLDPQWLLKRTYRHGLGWGIAKTRGGRPWALPIAKAALKRVNARMKAMVLRMLGGEQRRFLAAYQEARWKGRWDGLWQGRTWPEAKMAERPPHNRAAKAA